MHEESQPKVKRLSSGKRYCGVWECFPDWESLSVPSVGRGLEREHHLRGGGGGFAPAILLKLGTVALTGIPAASETEVRR